MRKLRPALIVSALLGTALLFGAPASAQEDSPQQPGNNRSAAAAPDQCLLWRQLRGDEENVRKTYNAPVTYNPADWQDVACGGLTFSLPRGKEALVDLSATAELDCNGEANSWCEGRFLVNGTPAHPDNTDRGDTYAWDSANGGSLNWQAHPLDQEYRAVCPSNNTAEVCSFRVQLQVRQQNGKPSLWLDDLTVRADVSYGRTYVVAVQP